MAKVKAIMIFHDLVEEKLRSQGEEFECTQARADVLNEKGLVVVLEADKVVEKIEPTKNKAVKPSHTK